MTKEELETKRDELLAQERQAFANFNAALGARKFCEHLIKEIEETEAKTGTPKKK
jgi:hypothetical protein